MSRDFDTRHSLVFSAGASAYREIRENGLSPRRIGTLAGASGGAKWLVLSQLDRVIAREVLPKLEGTVHTIGTSIGAWRFACYCQADPLAAIDRFEQAYLEQTYTEKPGRDEISARMAEILDFVLGDRGAAEILEHPSLRMHIMTVRSRNVTAVEQPQALTAGLIGAATLNVASRRSLGAFFERVLFYDNRDEPPFYVLNGFPMRRVTMTERNMRAAILATGAIPVILNGVRDIEGAPAGVYRDGGIIDYHLDFPHSAPDKLALYLHFYNFIKPGWFDKHLPWRKAKPESIDRTLLISPSPEFVAGLPNGKIPDRHDFVNLAPAERVKVWRGVVSACQEIADELEQVLTQNRLAERIRPLTSN